MNIQKVYIIMITVRRFLAQVSINSLHDAAQRGEPGAEKALFAKLSERFLYFVQLKIDDRDVCRDVVQEALITVARKYRGMTFESSFSAWAHNVILNKVMETYRRQKRSSERFVRMPDDIEFSVPNPEQDPLLESRLIDCLRKVSSTNNRQARILNLRHQGFSIDEIGQRLKMTRNSVYVTLSRARAMLKDCLEERNL